MDLTAFRTTPTNWFDYGLLLGAGYAGFLVSEVVEPARFFVDIGVGVRGKVIDPVTIGFGIMNREFLGPRRTISAGETRLFPPNYQPYIELMREF